jgi:hypothetical protein
LRLFIAVIFSYSLGSVGQLACLIKPQYKYNI